MVQNTFLLSTCAAVYLLASPLFASGPGAKINLEETETTSTITRDRSLTSPSRFSSSPPSSSEKGIFSRLSAKVNPKRKSEERTPPTSSLISSPDFLKELKERQAIRAPGQQATVQEQKEESKRKSEERTQAPSSLTQQAIVQEQKEEFPPKRLSSKQIQSVMKVSFLLALDMISNKSQERALPKPVTPAKLNNKIQACFATSPDRFVGLLVAARTNHINSLQEGQKKANDDASSVLSEIYGPPKEKNGPHPLAIYKDCTVDRRITAIRGEPITIGVYAYQFMVGDQKLNLPYLDGGTFNLLDGKVNFSFTKQPSE